MKRSHAPVRVLSVILVTATAMVITACASYTKPRVGITHKPRVGITQLDKVWFRVDDGEVEVRPENKNCKKAGAQKFRFGCITVPKWDRANIRMAIRRSKDWIFEAIEICPGDEKRPDTNVPCDMSVDQREQFVIFRGGQARAVPDEHGVHRFDTDAQVKVFFLLDQNELNEDYFYRIRLCRIGKPVTPQNCIWSDPPIINGGMGVGAFL